MLGALSVLFLNRNLGLGYHLRPTVSFGRDKARHLRNAPSDWRSTQGLELRSHAPLLEHLVNRLIKASDDRRRRCSRSTDCKPSDGLKVSESEFMQRCNPRQLLHPLRSRNSIDPYALRAMQR